MVSVWVEGTSAPLFVLGLWFVPQFVRHLLRSRRYPIQVIKLLLRDWWFLQTLRER